MHATRVCHVVCVYMQMQAAALPAPPLARSNSSRHSCATHVQPTFCGPASSSCSSAFSLRSLSICARCAAIVRRPSSAAPPPKPAAPALAGERAAASARAWRCSSASSGSAAMPTLGAAADRIAAAHTNRMGLRQGPLKEPPTKGHRAPRRVAPRVGPPFIRTPHRARATAVSKTRRQPRSWMGLCDRPLRRGNSCAGEVFATCQVCAQRAHVPSKDAAEAGGGSGKGQRASTADAASAAADALAAAASASVSMPRVSRG
eukprot:352561-Chlamydomonas_euryale.AAC.13